MIRDYKIIACDFDGTLCKDAYPDIGCPNRELITQLITRRTKGDKVILWTCRVGSDLEEAVAWCRKHGLEFDAVNANLTETITKYDNDCRKIFSDIYIDDKAVNVTELCVMMRWETLGSGTE